MKRISLFFALLCATFSYAQIPTYYNDVDLTLTNGDLQTALSQKVTSSQTTTLSYTPGVWDALKLSDRDPSDPNKVILIYGYSDSDGSLITDRTRNRESNGGASTDWNREHVFPRSLGSPNLGSSGPGSDAHHLRPSDPAMNSSRGNRKFQSGSGNAGVTSSGHFYPGDEFKGDVARMMMYMYLRYGSRCLPSAVGVGSVNSIDANMIDLFLTWNVEDPVSAFELNRNVVIEGIQGNRNPFIDNPAFATEIWGGPQAEDRFNTGTGGGTGENTLCNTTVNSFPYLEGFESNFGSWSQASSGDDFNWTRQSGGTISNNTGPSSAIEGSNYIYMESSTPNFSTKRAVLYGPCFDLTNETVANFSFRYHLYGAANMGGLSLEASLNGTSWTPVWSKEGNQGNTWETAVVNLDTYAGSKVQLRFNGITGTTWQGDMAVDDLRFLTTTVVGPPAPITQDVNLSITFDNYPEETSWEIKDASNAIVFSGGTYGSQADGSTINLMRTLENGCYTLLIKDTFGDGICCAYGNGSYTLTNTATGNVLASGASFTTEDVTNFCLTGTKAANEFQENNIVEIKKAEEQLVTVYPNPANNLLYIEVGNNDNMTYNLINSVGQIVMSGDITNDPLSIQSLPRGVYFIQFSLAEEQIMKRIILK